MTEFRIKESKFAHAFAIFILGVYIIQGESKNFCHYVYATKLLIATIANGIVKVNAINKNKFIFLWHEHNDTNLL